MTTVLHRTHVTHMSSVDVLTIVYQPYMFLKQR